MLAGRNGSGKSTLLRVLSTLLRPDHGQLRLFGRDPRLEADEVRRRTALLGHRTFLYEPLTALENLELWARLLGKDASRSALADRLSEVGLAERAHDPVAGFSAGMRQRLALGAGDAEGRRARAARRALWPPRSPGFPPGGRAARDACAAAAAPSSWRPTSWPGVASSATRPCFSRRAVWSSPAGPRRCLTMPRAHRRPRARSEVAMSERPLRPGRPLEEGPAPAVARARAGRRHPRLRRRLPAALQLRGGARRAGAAAASGGLPVAGPAPGLDPEPGRELRAGARGPGPRRACCSCPRAPAPSSTRRPWPTGSASPWWAWRSSRAWWCSTTRERSGSARSWA